MENFIEIKTGLFNVSFEKNEIKILEEKENFIIVEKKPIKKKHKKY